MKSVFAALVAASLLPAASLASEMRTPQQPSAAALQAQIQALKQQVTDLKKKVEALQGTHTTVCIAFRCA